MTQNPAPANKEKSIIKAPVLINSAEAEVLRALRKHGQTSRAEITNITGWSRAKTSQEVNSLVEKGYLMDVGEGVSRGGRKPRLLRFNSKLGYVVGIDIGATSLEQLKENLDSSHIQLNDEVLRDIELVHKDNPNPSP